MSPSIPPSSVPTPGLQAPPVVLSIAGFDPSAGAGVLADLKTFAAEGVYGMACITALTVQSTQGVRRVQPLPPDIVNETLDCLAPDASFASIKVGMLGTVAVARAVLGWLNRHPSIPVVLDPILQSSSGQDLLDSEGLELLRTTALARVQWMTPNLPELEALTGERIPSHPKSTRQNIESIAERLLARAQECGNPDLHLVVTGGHAGTPDDLWITQHSRQWFPGQHIETRSTHGTGCAFSASLAAHLALGKPAQNAVAAAKSYVTGALQHAVPIGQGKGPVHHLWRMAK